MGREEGRVSQNGERQEINHPYCKINQNPSCFTGFVCLGFLVSVFVLFCFGFSSASWGFFGGVVVFSNKKCPFSHRMLSSHDSNTMKTFIRICCCERHNPLHPLSSRVQPTTCPTYLGQVIHVPHTHLGAGFLVGQHALNVLAHLFKVRVLA